MIVRPSLSFNLVVSGFAGAIALALMASAAVAKQPNKVKLPIEYRVKLPTKVKAEIGKVAAISLTISAQPGFTISRQGPLRIELIMAANTGVTSKRLRYTRAHAADKRADSPRFDLQLHTAKVGAFRVTVATRFWVCARQTCWPVRDRRVVHVAVVAPSPAKSP